MSGPIESDRYFAMPKKEWFDLLTFMPSALPINTETPTHFFERFKGQLVKRLPDGGVQVFGGTEVFRVDIGGLLGKHT